jgi:CBS domain-containing protein
VVEAKVESVMTDRVVAVGLTTPVEDIVRILADNRFGAVPVIDGVGLVVGVVSEADLVAKLEFGGPSARTPANRAAERRLRKARGVVAWEVMTRPVVTVDRHDPVGLAAHRLAEAGVRRLFVLGDDELVGVVTRGDLLRLLSRRHSGTAT